MGNHLVAQHGFVKMSFASVIKDMLAIVFGWDRALLEGDTAASREWRERVDPWWSERLSMPLLSPRYALQQIGTELFRQKFHTDMWVAALENRIRNCKSDIVITDCRFPNEVEMLSQYNPVFTLVKRGGNPDWIIDGRLAAMGNINAVERLRKLGIHPSEYMWLNNTFDAVILNDYSLDYLKEKASELVQFSKEAHSSQFRYDSSGILSLS